MIDIWYGDEQRFGHLGVPQRWVNVLGRVDPERCVGCSICVQKCISGALFMRDRTPQELAALRED